RLQQATRLTTLLVTHDQEEAMTMADRVAVMNRGRLVQVDEPRRVYERPADAFTAAFVGVMNFVEGWTGGAGRVWRRGGLGGGVGNPGGRRRAGGGACGCAAGIGCRVARPAGERAGVSWRGGRAMSRAPAVGMARGPAARVRDDLWGQRLAIVLVVALLELFV